MDKPIAASTAILVAGLVFSASSPQAANARHPYQNVNHRNDHGNNTGNAGAARLNDEQLASIRGGTTMGSG